MKIIISSGFFGPVGVHHIKYLKAAKALGNLHIVILNRDYQVDLKGSCPFQDEEERFNILSELKCVDRVILSIDKDGGVADTLEHLVNNYETAYHQLDIFTGNKSDIQWIFAKGGDRTGRSKLPAKEVETADRLGIRLIFGVGGKEKEGASSSSLSKAFRWYLSKLDSMKYVDRKEYLSKIGYSGDMFE